MDKDWRYINMFTECYIHIVQICSVPVNVLFIKEKNKSIFYEYYHIFYIKFYGKM